MDAQFHNWRELLSHIIQDTQERQSIAEALGIHPLTLMRWASNKSKPRPENLRALLDAIPAQYQESMIKLIVLEFPHLLTGPAANTETQHTTIPSAFYTQVLNIHTSSPPILRTTTICSTIMYQMLSQLDPRQLGLAIFIAKCTPPSPGQPVRSLQRTMGRGNEPWRYVLEHQTSFFGAESQIGYAIVTGHTVSIQNHEEKKRVYPAHRLPGEEAFVASPLLRAEGTAGCLCVASTQPNYFTNERMELIQNYTNLMTIAFEPSEFYNLPQIELGIMPPYEQQRPYLENIQRRVTEMLLQAQRDGRALTRSSAEQTIWKDLEEQLLQLVLQT